MTADYQTFIMSGMSVNECVTENEDGSYTIFINGQLCQKKQLQAYQHALSHIKNDDFAKCDVQQIETKAHNN